jgi:hypothetical protein
MITTTSRTGIPNIQGHSHSCGLQNTINMKSDVKRNVISSGAGAR